MFRKAKKTKEVVDNTLINNFLHLYKIEIGGTIVNHISDT